MFLTTVNRPSLYPFGTSVDKMFDELFENSFKKESKYPATDIYVEDGVTYIEVAVTGFSEKDIDIFLENGILSIEASLEKDEKKDKEKDGKSYHIRNIAKRSFKRQFNVVDEVEDVKAKIKDGILYLELVTKEKEDTRKKIEFKK